MLRRRLPRNHLSSQHSQQKEKGLTVNTDRFIEWSNKYDKWSSDKQQLISTFTQPENWKSSSCECPYYFWHFSSLIHSFFSSSPFLKILRNPKSPHSIHPPTSTICHCGQPASQLSTGQRVLFLPTKTIFTTLTTPEYLWYQPSPFPQQNDDLKWYYCLY